MADLVTRDNLIQLFQFFAGQADKRYILEKENATATKKGGVKVGNGLSVNSNGTLDVTLTGGNGATYSAATTVRAGLMSSDDKYKLDHVEEYANAYTLPTASSTQKGGIIVGNGLEIDQNGVLEVTLQGGGTTLTATTLRAGLMSASDKAKLDGITAGDDNYTLPTATKTQLGGVKVGNGLQMVGESLNAALPLASTSQAGLIKIGGGLQMVGDSLNVVLSDESEYSLQPATTERLGGVKVGNGLRAEKDGTLKVTLDSGEKYAAFEGATAEVEGKSGLVPAPANGDQNKFLRGDGNWVTISERDAILAPDVASIQGALWQSVANGVPCLKFRYGDYEYNFDYDTITLLDNDAKPLNTSNKGMGYILSQAISTVSGGLWYEIQNGVPRLKIRQGSYEFGFNYNTVTYCGGKKNLVSYVPCDKIPLVDACISESYATLTAEANLRVADENDADLYQIAPGSSVERQSTSLFGKAITAVPGVTGKITLKYDISMLPPPVTTGKAYTTDCWFYFNNKAVDRAKINSSGQLQIIPWIYVTKQSKLLINVSGTDCETGKAVSQKVYEMGSYVNKPHHFAITCSMVNNKALSRFALDGKFIVEQQGTRSIFGNGSSYSITEYGAFNKIRWFNEVIWKDNFTPPTAADYL